MDKFKQIYIHMFYQEAGTLKFDQKKYRQFLDNAYKITKVIQQDKKLSIDVPDQLIQYCLDNSKQIIPTKNIIQLMKKSKHYSNVSLKKSFDLIVYPFDFNKDSQINSFHYECFNIKDQNILDLMLNEFKNRQLNKTFGFCNNYQNIYICAINTNQNQKSIIETIYHELSHYIQQICNVHIISKQIKTNKFIKQKLIKNGITEKSLNYLFNNHQFFPHLDDLLRQMKYLYINKYKTLLKSPYDFVQFIKEEIKKDGINNQLKKDLIDLNIFNMEGLFLLKASFVTHYRFEMILKRIEMYCLSAHKD